MNPWRRGSPTHNPYSWTAHRVCRVSKDVTRHQTVVQTIGQTRRLINADPQAHTVRGRLVTSADLNVAEQILLDPRQRAAEDLLEHAPERPRLERVRRLAAHAATLMGPEGAAMSGLPDAKALAPIGAALVVRFLDDSPRYDASFGALELTPMPPFGTFDEDN